MKRFENKAVLVTGGNSGIGLATARAFAKEGARVVITGRDQKTLDEARKALGESAIVLRSDAGDLASARTLAEVIAKANIKLDAIFINAGVAKVTSL